MLSEGFKLNFPVNFRRRNYVVSLDFIVNVDWIKSSEFIEGFVTIRLNYGYYEIYL